MRSLAEWLAVLLLPLPVLLVAGFLLWVRDTRRTDLARFEDGAREARRWLEGDGPAAWLPERFLQSFAPERRPFGDESWVLLDLPAGRCRVRAAPASDPAPWSFGSVFAGGLSAEGLADPGVRLQVEAGRAPLDLDAVDPAARLLADLLGRPGRPLPRPDLEGLRAAALPAATKLFVAERWAETERAPTPGLLAAREVLLLGRAYERAVAGRPGPLGPGAWSFGDVEVLASGGLWPAWVFPRGGTPEETLLSEGPEDSPARLVWTSRPEDAPDGALWSGRLDAPLAGSWRFESRHGTSLAASPRFRRWAGPVAVAAAALATLTLGLFVSLRRRRRLDEARVRFLDDVAHDLRTPLASLRLHAELLARDGVEGAGVAQGGRPRRHAERIAHEAARLSGLLANLLDLTRLERGAKAGRRPPAEVEVPALAEVARQEFLAVHPARGGDLALEGVAGVRARADPDLLARVLANLLDNAGKFTTPGTPIRLSWEARAGRVRIGVADEGPGIAPSERRRLFRRHARGAAARRSGTPGLGLGLALVRDLVGEMGGDVALVPSATGARFDVTLPEAARD